MNTTVVSSIAQDTACTQDADLRGLDSRERFAAFLHAQTEQCISEGMSSEDAAYFLISAAQAALDQKPDFATDATLAREYLQAARELL